MILTLIFILGAIANANEPPQIGDPQRIYPIPPRVRTVNTFLPLPGGGTQLFQVPVRRATRTQAAAAPSSLSFTLQCPVPATFYRIDTSTDLVHWTTVYTSANSTTVVLDCALVQKKFWRITPLP